MRDDQAGSTEHLPAAMVGRHRRADGRSPVTGLVAVAGVALAAALATGAFLVGLLHHTGTPSRNAVNTAVTPAAATPIAARPVTATQLAGLPQATTFTTLTAAPHDNAPTAEATEELLHPKSTVPIYTAPGGPPLAALPAQQLGGETWLPVIATEPGWVRVLLPTRPNGATGWVSLNALSALASDPYRIIVDREHFTLTVTRDETTVHTWTIGVGAARTPTPAGRTFILASLRDTHPTYSPIILPLGAHSDVYTTFSGGPATIGLHGWPNPSVFGRAASNGCLRVPPDALRYISSVVPIGTTVTVH